MADWALQAVIRPKQYDDGYFGSIDTKQEYDQALLFCFPHLFDHHQHHHAPNSAMETVVGDELDQLYQPLYPNFGTDQIKFPPLPTPSDLQTIHHHHRHDSDQEFQQDHEQDDHMKKFCGSASKISQLAPKLKKRKNQQKREVVQVTVDGLSSDPWAWRKYGQKPIKGSIYPRSYYRCSSSKGCMARRQVEQSCTDPSIYILTYTADHNHAQPTRRNSLAGINRNKFKSAQKIPTISDSRKNVTRTMDSQSPFHSPTTPSVSSNDDEGLHEQINIKEETIFYSNFDDQGHSMINDDELMVFSDDFFEGLDDLSSFNSSNKQLPHGFS